MPLSTATPNGQLTINSVALNNAFGAWRCLDLSELWLRGAQRGRDRVLPGATGVIPYRRRITVTEVDLPMVIGGDVDRLGNVNSNKISGFQVNLEYLMANVVAPTGAGDGTRAATLTLPSTTTRTADVHVLGLELGRAFKHGKMASLTISIPVGAFA
jgi:hypothetical protein